MKFVNTYKQKSSPLSRIILGKPYRKLYNMGGNSYRMVLGFVAYHFQQDNTSKKFCIYEETVAEDGSIERQILNKTGSTPQECIKISARAFRTYWIDRYVRELPIMLQTPYLKE